MRLAPLLALVFAAPVALAQTAPTPGTCTLGTAEATLDVGDVRAALFNTGSLFYGNGTVSRYQVPQASGVSPIYAAGLWLGGLVGGELRVAGGTYGPAPGMDFTFWPGPLGPDARPVSPADCSGYDRIYTVSRADVAAYYATGEVTADLRDWPAGLGAPVIDGDGDPGNYDLAGGDQPAVRGDQTAWWVMNDVGNVHTAQGTAPLGVEVRVEAVAFSARPQLAQTTLYRYTVTNRTAAVIDSVYAGVWSDPDLGFASDDYVGTDTTRGMAYVYNADDDDDEGTGGYGSAPPALGFQVLSGPVGLANGRDDDGDGATDEPGERLRMTSASRVCKSQPICGEPNDGVEIHYRLQGLFSDGSTMRAFGNGVSQTEGAATVFAFPGDPVTNQPWSEVNSGNGPLAPEDKRALASTGPFRLAPGASETIVIAVPFARGTSHLDSVTRLRRLADALQVISDAGYFEAERVPGFGGPVPVPDGPVALSRPSPNPFTGRAVVRYEMPAGTPVRAALYDVLGRRVAVVHDGPTAERAGEFVVDGRSLAPGTYLLRVRVPAGEQVLTLVRAR